MFLLAIAASLAIVAPGHAGPPAGLSASGRTLWNFEGLLQQTFPHEFYGVKTVDYLPDFVGGLKACPDMASCQIFSTSFTPHTATSFHLVAQRPSGSFGNYPQLVMVEGDYVACDPASTHYLIAYGDTMNFGLDCLKPGR